MSQVQDIAQKIESAIAELDKLRQHLPETYNAMVIASAKYDGAIGIAMAKMSMGAGIEIDGHVIKQPAMAVIKEYAKAACTEEKIAMMTAECKYKSLLKNMEHAAAKLSALQTLFRHLDVV